MYRSLWTCTRSMELMSLLLTNWSSIRDDDSSRLFSLQKDASSHQRLRKNGVRHIIAIVPLNHLLLCSIEQFCLDLFFKSFVT